MSTQLKLRRGTTAQHSTFTGASGEVTVDTTKKTLVVHDGSTPGGVPLQKEAFQQSGTGATARTVDSKLKDFVSVKDFGAVGDGTTDDTTAFVNAIAYAKPLRRTVYMPNGTYKITSTLELTGGDFYGASLVGENREGTKIKSFVSGTTPVVSMTGGSGTATNVYCSDFTIVPNTQYNGTGIYINGQCLAVCERISMAEMKYGIWLHNQSAGAFSELNTFRDMWITGCDNGIRMEQGSGNDSFHGCTFDGIWMNVYSARSQIGFNHVSGYYYNGHFKLHIWTDGANSQILQHNGNSEYHTGSIQVEAFGASGFINGTGKWIYEGELLGIGGSNINSGYGSGQPLFACKNRISTPATLSYIGNGFLPSGMSLNALDQPIQRGNGIQPAMVKVNGASNQDSVGAIVYNGSAANNGFWVFDIGFQRNAGEARPLWKHGADGSFGYSYSTGTTRGTNYAVWASRSPKGPGSGNYANDDGSIRFSRSNYHYNADGFTHDAGFVIATNMSVRDGAPTDRIWVDGQGIYPATDNTYSCGTSTYRFSTIYAATGTINTSDKRQKDEIQDASLGLEFINALRPVSYKWKVGSRTVKMVPDGEEEYQELEPVEGEDGNVVWKEVTKTRPKFREEVTDKPGKRTHWGLIAQEVKQAVDAAGVDFAGWVKDDPTDPESGEGLRYDQFIAPLIKAVQDLSAKVAALEAKLGK